LKTHLTLIVHAKELKRTTNTGRLAARALVNSEVVVRGLGPVQIPLHLGHRPLLLFPGENARELTAELVAESALPAQLLVPDGNWRQASKVALRHPELAGAERVKISRINDADQHLRRENHPSGMSTLEAVAWALRVLEGEEAFWQLRAFYLAKLGATLAGRAPESLVGVVSQQN
jgi:DTW domain-containing protein YfiP